MQVTIVFYTMPLFSGKIEEGVEAFLNPAEADAFVKTILRDPGTSAQIVKTTKDRIVSIAIPPVAMAG